MHFQHLQQHSLPAQHGHARGLRVWGVMAVACGCCWPSPDNGLRSRPQASYFTPLLPTAAPAVIKFIPAGMSAIVRPKYWSRLPHPPLLGTTAALYSQAVAFWSLPTLAPIHGSNDSLNTRLSCTVLEKIVWFQGRKMDGPI